jgi:hypothetical protein
LSRPRRREWRSGTEDPVRWHQILDEALGHIPKRGRELLRELNGEPAAR